MEKMTFSQDNLAMLDKVLDTLGPVLADTLLNAGAGYITLDVAAIRDMIARLNAVCDIAEGRGVNDEI
jgi:hypothetical protein